MKTHRTRPAGLITETEALQELGWQDKMSNRIKLGQHWQGDTVSGHARVRWYWLEAIQKLRAPNPAPMLAMKIRPKADPDPKFRRNEALEMLGLTQSADHVEWLEKRWEGELVYASTGKVKARKAYSQELIERLKDEIKRENSLG